MQILFTAKHKISVTLQKGPFLKHFFLHLFKIELNQETTVHILTCVCLEAIKTARRAERAWFAGNVKSIENCS